MNNFTELDVADKQNLIGVEITGLMGEPLIIEVPPNETHKNTIVWCHGWSANTQKWGSWFPQRMDIKNTKWVFLQAPLTVNPFGGDPVPAWYKLPPLDQLPPNPNSWADEEGMLLTAKVVGEVIEREKNLLPQGGKIIQGGHSQGGASSFLTGLSKPHVDGIICIAGYLPIPFKLASIGIAPKNLPIIWLHGTEDAEVPHSMFEYGTKQLKEVLGMTDVTAVTLPGIHHKTLEIAKADLSPLKAFIQKVFE